MPKPELNGSAELSSAEILAINSARAARESAARDKAASGVTLEEITAENMKDPQFRHKLTKAILDNLYDHD